jgi:hypothetical protein
MSERLLTPYEWELVTGIQVLDPDGWRVDGKSWLEPVSLAEFSRRVMTSTIGGWSL